MPTGFPAARLLLTFLLLLWTPRKTAKENLAQTSSTITENLMGISRVMSQQVQQSEEAMQTLGNAGLEGKLLPGHRHLPQAPLPRPRRLPCPRLPVASVSICGLQQGWHRKLGGIIRLFLP